jgi:hypothetical protein
MHHTTPPFTFFQASKENSWQSWPWSMRMSPAWESRLHGLRPCGFWFRSSEPQGGDAATQFPTPCKRQQSATKRQGRWHGRGNLARAQTGLAEWIDNNTGRVRNEE